MIVALAGLVALGLGVLLALPWLVDAPRVQAYVAQTASQVLGRPVRFASFSVSAFPTLSLRLKGLQVAEDPRFGTHHARDAHGLFETLGYDLNLFSSALKLNTQYMHSIHFSLTLDREITLDEIKERLAANKRVAITYRRSANSVFSFGRDHGYFGRILSQTVVAIETVAIRNGNEVVGFCFTPQDGNPLLSTLAATLWYMDPASVDARLDIMRPYLFQEV